MVKAAIFALDGAELGSARRSNQVKFPLPGHTEVDPEEVWWSVCATIQDAMAASGTTAGEIVGISATGHGNGLYAVDRAGRPILPGIISTDRRAAAIGPEWHADGRGCAAEAAIMQRFWPGQTLSLLGWFDRHRPGVLDRAAALFGSKDYVRGRLTGELSTDITEAAVSGLADLRTDGYATSLFQDLGFGQIIARLPPIRPSFEVAAGLSAEAATATGLVAGTPVIRGLTDVVACAVASGVASPDTMSVVAGTFSINQTLHRNPRRSPAPTLQVPYPIDNLFLATECSATSASNLEWVCRTLLPAEAAEERARGRSIYDLCGDWVGGALGRANDILFLPFLFGGPGDAPAGLIGLTASHDRADVIRAVFEGIAFAHKLDADRLMTGPDAASPSLVRLAGGAARSPIWPQIFADVLGRVVEVPTGGELGARGAAMSVAVGLGQLPSMAIAVDKMVGVARRYTPDPGRETAYGVKFSRFAATVAALGSAASVPIPAMDRVEHVR